MPRSGWRATLPPRSRHGSIHVLKQKTTSLLVLEELNGGITRRWEYSISPSAFIRVFRFAGKLGDFASILLIATRQHGLDGCGQSIQLDRLEDMSGEAGLNAPINIGRLAGTGDRDTVEPVCGMKLT